MSGVFSFQQTRTCTRHKLKKAKIYHDSIVEQAASDDNAGALGALQSSSAIIQLASDVEGHHFNKGVELQGCKDLVTFFAKYHDYVILFEDMVFISFFLRIPTDISLEVASAVATTESVLSTLGRLTQAEGRADENQDDKAYVEAFGWVKKAWKDAVVARGLSYSDYELVREFKQKSNGAFYRADFPEDALRFLESVVPVLADIQKYKEPLKALLKLVA